jgi:hypothetical protein
MVLLSQHVYSQGVEKIYLKPMRDDLSIPETMRPHHQPRVARQATHGIRCSCRSDYVYSFPSFRPNLSHTAVINAIRRRPRPIIISLNVAASHDQHDRISSSKGIIAVSVGLKLCDRHSFVCQSEAIVVVPADPK